MTVDVLSPVAFSFQSFPAVTPRVIFAVARPWVPRKLRPNNNSNSEEAKFFADGIDKWAKVTRFANIKVD